MLMQQAWDAARKLDEFIPRGVRKDISGAKSLRNPRHDRDLMTTRYSLPARRIEVSDRSSRVRSVSTGVAADCWA